MSSKFEIEQLKQIFKEESTKIVMDNDVIFNLVGYDSEVEIVFVEQNEDSPEELTFEMLREFEKRIKKEINSRWYVGIFYTDLEAAEKEKEDIY
tara:strand:+ start:273 stop:554 length:282 start_codon:yes stop_codon:yes gene_type:complete